MIDMTMVKMHLKTGVVGDAVIVLEDMLGPVDVNGGMSFAARSMSLTGITDDVEMAKAIHKKLNEEGHNAFAFYQLLPDVIRFGSIKIGYI